MNQINEPVKVIAYLRISTKQQDFDIQKLELHEYAYHHNLKIDEFIEAEVSSRQSNRERRIDFLLSKLKCTKTFV